MNVLDVVIKTLVMGAIAAGFIFLHRKQKEIQKKPMQRGALARKNKGFAQFCKITSRGRK